jgi:hypothetical protein
MGRGRDRPCSGKTFLLKCLCDIPLDVCAGHGFSPSLILVVVVLFRGSQTVLLVLVCCCRRYHRRRRRCCCPCFLFRICFCFVLIIKIRSEHKWKVKWGEPFNYSPNQPAFVHHFRFTNAIILSTESNKNKQQKHWYFELTANKMPRHWMLFSDGGNT